MRLFVGTLLGASSQARCDRFVSALVAGRRTILRGIPPGSAHLTYAFCASVPEDRMDLVTRVVALAAAEHEPIFIRARPARVAPTGSRPRLVCADIGEGASRLAQLAEGIATSLQRECPDLEWRSSREPHVTLARFRRQTRPSDAHAVKRALEAVPGPAVEDRVVGVQIVASDVTGAGPVYRVIAETPLLAPGSPGERSQQP